MSNNDLIVAQFDPTTATEDDFARINVIHNRIRQESWPDDPIMSVEQTIRDERSRPDFVETKQWTVSRASTREIVATAYVNFWLVGENQHACDFNIAVLPEARRQGIATMLLPRIAALAQERNRRLVIAWTTARAPAGGAFMEHLGAEMALAHYSNELRIEDLDRELVRKWQERADSLKGDFELGLWVGPYPEKELEAIAHLATVMNTAPRGTLDLQDWTVTTDEIRDWEASLERRRVERWTMYVRDRHSGAMAGYTEVHWNPEEPTHLWQSDTGVFPEYRNRGLGTWLKASMLDKVLRDRPQVRVVRTGNAQSNEPMLRINYQLGFKPSTATFSWQLSLAQLLSYLAARGISIPAGG